MTTTEVLHLHDSGLTTTKIAARLGITQHRVERILDREAEAAGPLVEYVQAPCIEPLRGDVQTQPEKVKTRRSKSQPKPRKAYQHGTPYGHKAHKKAGEDPCAACVEGMRSYSRQYWRISRDRKRSAVSV